MDVTITVVRASTGVRADARITAADTDLTGPLLDDLRTLVGAGGAESVHVDSRELDPAGTAGGCELTDGQLLIVGPTARITQPLPPDRSGLVLAVAAGPAAGARIALTGSRVTVGRDPSCDLRLDDDAVSRCQLAVTMADDGAVLVEDLGSRNGTTVAGRQLEPHQPVRVELGDAIGVGSAELTVRAGRPSARLLPMADGRLAVHRSPRTPLLPRPVEIRRPPAPMAPTPARLPIVAAVGPLVVGVLLAFVLHQWQLLAFTVLSPVLIGSQAVSDRRSSRRTHHAALAEHEHRLATARDTIAAALAEEQVRRHAAAPDLAALVGAATERTGELWQRGRDDPDALVLRLGRGEPVSAVTVADEAALHVVDVPVGVPLLDVGVLGVAGPVMTVTAVARSLVLQAATLHGPGQCRLVVIAPGRIEEWAWVRWLPHTLPIAGEGCTVLMAAEESQARARLEELAAADTEPGSPITLVLVDAIAVPGARPLEDALDVITGRCATVWLAADPARLPAGCGGIVRIDVDGSLTLSGLVEAVVGIRPDLPCREVAEAAARALAPLRDSDMAAATSVPATVSWSDVVGLDLTDRDAAMAGLTRSWLAGPTTAVPLGRGAAVDVVVDLAVDGPHALVAGTTGSGKSELLQTLVAGLAAANRPEDLALLLVDFKGGAAFGSCRRLPHTVGVVTDLDTASTGRALTSLDAELRRRERILATLGVADLSSYAAAASRASAPPPRPPRLVIVVDEFATLVEELPDFVGGLVGIAQRGRSLGVHLVLATQRPEGVVSADIRANTRLRICLAVARDSDSRDVIDGPQAAAIGRDTPGRAYLRAGPGELTIMQTARVSGAGTTTRRQQVTLSPVAHLGRPPARVPTDTGQHTDLDRLADAAIETARRLGCVQPSPPWLPPLPAALGTSVLPAAAPGQAAWGLVDLPDQQRQVPLTVDLTTGGTLLVVGTARSGRTTMLRSLAVAAAAALSPEQLHLWAVDGGGGLATLDELPHCGGVVPAYDVDRLDRLLTRTAAEVARRRIDGWADQPLFLLAVDGWEALLAQAGDHDGGSLVESLLRLAADGPAAGLRLVITSGRGGLTGRLGAVAPDRLVLRLPDRSDFSLIGLATRDVPDDLPAGRAVRAADLSLVQIAVPDGPTVARAAAWPTPRHHGVRRVDPLPELVTFEDIAAAGTLDDGRSLRVGLRVEDHAPALHDLADGGGTLLIAGPPRSGRSSALLLIAAQLAPGPVALLCPRRSPLTGLSRPNVVALPADDQEHAAALLTAMAPADSPPLAVLVDDVDLLGDGPLADRLTSLARTARDGRSLVVLAGPTDALMAAFRGPIAEARRARAGLLLRPGGPHDGELFGIRLPRRDARRDPPGRGWLAVHGEAAAVQVARPPDVGSGGCGGLLLRQGDGASLLR